MAPAENIARLAEWRLLGVNAADLKTLFSVERAVGLAETPAAFGDDADAAPRTIRHFKDLGQQLLRGQISGVGHDALVGVLDVVFALF